MAIDYPAIFLVAEVVRTLLSKLTPVLLRLLNQKLTTGFELKCGLVVLAGAHYRVFVPEVVMIRTRSLLMAEPLGESPVLYKLLCYATFFVT